MRQALTYYRVLRAAPTFDAVAQCLLERLSAEVCARLPSATCNGGFVQVRRGDSEYTAHDGDRLPVSATLRRAVDSGAPAMLLVSANAVLSAEDGFVKARQIVDHGSASRSVLSQRGVRFLLGLPVLAPPQTVLGMVALGLELDTPPANLAALLPILEPLVEFAVEGLCTRPAAARTADFEGLPARSTALETFLAELDPFAQDDEPLLLIGAAGLGQPDIVEWCHRRSGRPGDVHIAQFDLDGDRHGLELFGWTSAPVPGAAPRHSGILVEARRGTVFIDAIEDLPRPIQGRLVEALVKRTVRPEGATRSARFGGRLIFGMRDWGAASRLHPALRERVSWARFHVPPLRERRSELAGWAQSMVAKMPEGDRATLAPDALTWIQARQWSENLLTLEAVIRRALSSARAASVPRQPIVVHVDHLRAAGRIDSDQASRLRTALDEAAACFVDLSASLPAETLTLAHTDAFAGIVLAHAIDRFGKRDAFKVLGRQADLHRDNHHRTARRHAARVAGLSEILNGSPKT